MGAGWRRFSEQASPSAPNRYPCHDSNGPLQPAMASIGCHNQFHALTGSPHALPRPAGQTEVARWGRA
jgi:hypothetical protein